MYLCRICGLAPVSGKTVGWEPIEQSPFIKAFRQVDVGVGELPPGTYELCGPKVQGNPEGYETHRLIRHAVAERVEEPPREFEALLAWLLARDGVIEGIVWHRANGDMAKLKVKDAKATLR